MSFKEFAFCIILHFKLNTMRIHFIAIGGSAMHNLAIALHLKGYQITGSDDEIFDPAKSRLEKYRLLPGNIGWNPNLISNELDAVILGMHARIDNPELVKAKELNLKIYSYPEFLYEQSKEKLRIVIGGSHGKTTITAMIIHVLQSCNLKCDYMVGAQLAGFEVMVKLTDDAPIMVIEGDEYLTSPIDRRPKFHVYKPNIGVISGIAWDHINVFPTFDFYVEQFKIFAEMIPENGSFIFCQDDFELNKLSKTIQLKNKIGYSVHPYVIKNGITYLCTSNGEVPLKIFGKHNLSNINAAKQVCTSVGVTDEQFYHAISTFKGASNRLELMTKNNFCAVYKDFAHSPSKLRATVEAVREQYPDRKLIACMELHTFSSLTKQFLNEYKGCMDTADTAIVFYNPEAVAHKKLPPIDIFMIFDAFGRKDLIVLNESKELESKLLSFDKTGTVFLLMSSGNFNGIQIKELSEKIVHLQP
jgi:UDP-N-acetylmuramate: L-alanyl-gamma-D-glutamyl-meso-diaminopimelate ligase